MTELIWDGKYKDGKKQGPVRIALPFQTIETVNESAQDRKRNLDLFASGRDTEWRNRLIWGDKKYVLPSLLRNFSGQINLVYIDPPFFTGTDQQIVIRVTEGEFFEKEPSLVEEAAYRNVWRSGSDSFCQWTYETLSLLYELLHPKGWLFVRHDQYWSHYVKVVADEVFGKPNFHNEIVVGRIHKNVTEQGQISIRLKKGSCDSIQRPKDLSIGSNRLMTLFWILTGRTSPGIRLQRAIRPRIPRRCLRESSKRVLGQTISCSTALQEAERPQPSPRN